MKSFLLLCALFFTISMVSQERFTLKTKYNIGKTYGESLKIMRVDSVVTIKYKKGEPLPIQKKVYVNDKEKFIDTDENYILKEDIKETKLDTIVCKDCPDSKYAFVKLKEDILFVNYYLRDDTKREGTYLFKLQNRETITLRHSGLILSGLTIPIKYRFGFKDNDIEVREEFTASFNLNLMLSYTFRGRTSFTYLKNVDNSIRDHSFNISTFVGGSPVTLNRANTSTAGMDRLDSQTTYTKGVLSSGVGFNYTFNSLGIGIFYGYDFAVGEDSDIWDYDGRPWLGVALGIDILKLGNKVK